MNYPSAIIQYGPTPALEDFLKQSISYPLFRELDPATQEVIRIAGQPISFEDLFFQICLFRIWGSPAVWQTISQVTKHSMYAFSFRDAIGALNGAAARSKVPASAWNKAKWTPETEQTAAEFHFRALAQMIEDGRARSVAERRAHDSGHRESALQISRHHRAGCRGIGPRHQLYAVPEIATFQLFATFNQSKRGNRKVFRPARKAAEENHPNALVLVG